MPKYGQVHFGKVYFGEDTPRGENYKRSFANIPLGVRVRKQIGKQVIFRVRRGNGHAGAVAGIEYQDKYGYFVPDNISNVESAPYRTHWKASVDYWQNILSTEEKQAYNTRANKGLHMSGYNLFMQAAMRGEIAMFVDRGDPAAVDFALTDLTTDAAWQNLSLVGIAPSTARAVLLEVDIEGSHTDEEITFRKDGNTNEINHTGAVTKANNKDQHKTCIVGIESNGIIEYKATDTTWTTINITVRGWWT